MIEAVNPFELPYVSLNYRQGLPCISGIYFVIQGNSEILYIGQSENLRNRWRTHDKLPMINKLGGDSRIAWLKVEKASLVETEAEFISYYQPSLNIARYIPWKSGKTVTVRVPIALEDVTLKVARAVDSGKITFEQIFQKLYEKYPHLKDL